MLDQNKMKRNEAQVVQTSIEQVLGSPYDRYFGHAYRCFHLSIQRFKWSENEVQGELLADYRGPTRPREEAPHLGSIEFLAFALQLATYGVNRLAKISITDTERGFMKNYSIQLNKSIPLGIHAYSCRLIRSTQNEHSMQGSSSQFEVIIGDIRVQLEIDHRGGYRYARLPASETIPLHTEQLHSLGYKNTDLHIGTLIMDLENKHISTEIKQQYLFGENSLPGIASARHALLATDATRVFGQLMQVLLYSTEGTDRQQCQNIWLRKMNLTMDRPLFTQKAKAYIVFDHIREINKGDQKWRLIQLHGQVGNYKGSFEIAYVVNA